MPCDLSFINMTSYLIKNGLTTRLLDIKYKGLQSIKIYLKDTNVIRTYDDWVIPVHYIGIRSQTSREGKSILTSHSVNYTGMELSNFKASDNAELLH